MDFLKTAFSTVGSKEPSSVRLLFGLVVITMCAPVWVQTTRFAISGIWVPMDAQAIAYGSLMATLVGSLLAYSRFLESKEMNPTVQQNIKIEEHIQGLPDQIHNHP